MNIPEYIASGILESYVMGAVSDQERREVECLSSIYPELRQELDQLTETLENYAFAHSVEPPAFIKEKLLQQLEFSEPDDVDSTGPEPIIRPLPVPETTGLSFRTTWIVAASAGLLVLLFAFFLLSQLQSTQKTLASIRESNNSLQTELRQLRENQASANQALALLQPGLRTIMLKGNEKAPDGKLMVLWNTQTHEVSVDVKSLPPLPADKQYQLWSMVDGKPVDAGVFDASNGANVLAQRLNRSVERAEAFAVTIENRGGSPTPTLSTLLALATVNS